MTASGKRLSAQAPPPARRLRLRWVLLGLGIVVAALAGWCWHVGAQIGYYASMDQAANADAIVVFGAAEYDGKPSPVFRARLDHAHDLFDRHIAPLIVTLGGPGGDEYTEGGLGQE